MIVNQILGSETQLTQFQEMIADYNNDGLINISDIVLIVNQILGEQPQQQSAIMNEVKRLLQSVTK